MAKQVITSLAMDAGLKDFVAKAAKTAGVSVSKLIRTLIAQPGNVNKAVNALAK